MSVLADLLVGLVAFLHAGFLVLEMFLWRKPVGMKAFRMSREKAQATAVLAMNQGLYNGFLAAGLIASLVLSDPGQSHLFRVFFLGCAIAAGLFGAATASRSILFVQALPAAVAMLAVYSQR